MRYKTNAAVPICTPVGRDRSLLRFFAPRLTSVAQEAMIQECVRAGFLKRNNLSGLILMDEARLEKVRSVS